MLELLAVPAWNTPPTQIGRWVEVLEEQGLVVKLDRESPTASWVDVPALGLRGYALTDGLKVEAVNFELTAPDPAPARRAVEEAAGALAWEVHDEEDDDNDD